MFTENPCGSGACPRWRLIRHRKLQSLPPTPKRLVQSNTRLQPRQPQLHIQILRRIQGALCLQHRQQVLGPGLVAALGDVERRLRLVQLFPLPLPLFIQPANAVQGFFHVGETIDDRPAVVLQQFFLARRGLVALGAQAAVVEDRVQAIRP